MVTLAKIDLSCCGADGRGILASREASPSTPFPGNPDPREGVACLPGTSPRSPSGPSPGARAPGTWLERPFPALWKPRRPSGAPREPSGYPRRPETARAGLWKRGMGLPETREGAADGRAGGPPLPGKESFSYGLPRGSGVEAANACRSRNLELPTEGDPLRLRVTRWGDAVRAEPKSGRRRRG